MKLIRRPLAPKEVDFELLLGGVLILSLIFGALLVFLRVPLPKCALRQLCGIPCVACGSTRAITGLLQGRFLEAFLYNPLVVFGLCVSLLWLGYAACVAGRPTPRWRFVGFTTTSRVILVSMVAANWIYLFFRL